ncbi:MAG: hypothetical protein ACRC62_15295 [Microcoleus sp.]
MSSYSTAAVFNPELKLPWLTSDIQAEIVAEANDGKISAPFEGDRYLEACGFIVREGPGAACITCTNISPDPTNNFAIAPEVYDKYKDSIVAVWHSHGQESDRGCLSFQDCANAQLTKRPQLLFHRDSRQWDYYDPLGSHPWELFYESEFTPQDLEYYLEWRFDWGRCDCCSLALHYYLGRVGVKSFKIPHPRRDRTINQIYEKDWTYLVDNLRANGFCQVPYSDRQQHDLILQCRDSESPHHVMIVATPELDAILHIVGKNAISRLEAIPPEDNIHSVWHLSREVADGSVDQ